MELVGAFGSLRDAELAARFLTERGLATKAMELGIPAMKPTGPTPCSERRRRLARPLMYAAFGAILVGLVGNVLWNLLLPDVLSTVWRVVATMLAGVCAVGSVGLLVDNGLAVRSRSGPAGGSQIVPPTGEERAAVAVHGLQQSQVDYAAKLLRWAGADRVLVRDDTC